MLPLQAELIVGSNFATSSGLHLAGTHVLSAATTFSALQTHEISRNGVLESVKGLSCAQPKKIGRIRG